MERIVVDGQEWGQTIIEFVGESLCSDMINDCQPPDGAGRFAARDFF